jgi:hypothetical protein
MRSAAGSGDGYSQRGDCARACLVEWPLGWGSARGLAGNSNVYLGGRPPHVRPAGAGCAREGAAVICLLRESGPL